MSSQDQPSSFNPYYYFIEQEVRAMMKKESTTYKVSRDYFRYARDAASSRTEVEVSPLTRKVMLSWGFQIVDSYKIQRQVALIAIGYFDRFLSSPSLSSENALSNEYDFQLCFVACMFIAIKNYAGVTADFHFVSDTVCKGLYDAKELSEMEMDILQGLGWRLNGPSAMDFVHAFMQMMPPREKSSLDAITQGAESLVETAMMDYSLALHQPSLIAFSSILVASDFLDVSYSNPLDKAKWMQSIGTITGIKEENFMIQAISAKMVRNSYLSRSDGSEVSATGVDETIYCYQALSGLSEAILGMHTLH